MASGHLITVVGPSGAGKDAILAQVKDALPDLVFVRRTITRPKDDGFEDHEPVTEASFQRLADEGAFLVAWSANGLRYGIPVSVRAELAAGRRVIFNGSRAALPHIAAIFPAIKVLSVEVSKEVLRQRLENRGRETAEEIDARLARRVPAFPSGLDVSVIDNSGPLEDAVAQMIEAISRQTRDGTAA